MKNCKILLLDDDIKFLNTYKKILECNGYESEITDNPFKALELINNKDIKLVVTDMIMPKMNGIEFIKRAKKIRKEIKIIVLTGNASVENAVEAMKNNAYSYIQKPVNIEEFLIEIRKTIEFLNLTKENEILRNEIKIDSNFFVGDSNNIKDIKEKIPIIADCDSNVLITGESGVGKEVVAKLIHQASSRNKIPMIKLSCASLSSTLLESELFGHEKGAFTGANTMKKGRFEIADGNTLFLDEIGEISVTTQVKLLRVIQEKEFERVGGINPIHSDFRLICATNKNLKEEVEKGNFREDLYYRLNVIPIYVPPLRERKEDIKKLIIYFSNSFAYEMGKKPIKFSQKAMDVLLNYEWPGNIRELKNIIERITVFSNGNIINENYLHFKVKKKCLYKDYSMNLIDAKQQFEKEFIKDALNNNNWNITRTADKIGIARKNLQLKVKKYRLN